MLNFTDDTMWLNVTNIALGVVVLAAIIVVARVFAAELFGRVKESFAAQHSPAHELYVPGLGLTMADGGESIDKKNDAPAQKTPDAPSQK